MIWSDTLKTILLVQADHAFWLGVCEENCIPMRMPNMAECLWVWGGKRAYFWHYVCMCQRIWANGSEHTFVYVWVWRAVLPHTLTFVRKTMCFWINTRLFACWFYHRSISICNISHLFYLASFWRGRAPLYTKKAKGITLMLKWKIVLNREFLSLLLLRLRVVFQCHHFCSEAGHCFQDLR